MPIIRTVSCLVLAALLGMHAAAGAFEVTLDAPDFTLRVPSLPDFVLQERANPNQASTRILIGGDKTYEVEIALSREPRSVTPRECAGIVLRALLARPGMPNRDNVYRAPLSVSTFLVIYVLAEAQHQRLHAHLISAAGPTHCADAHFARSARPDEDHDEWRQSFSDARIEDRTR